MDWFFTKNKKNEEEDDNDNDNESLTSKRKEGRKYIKTTEDEPNSTFELILLALSWFIAILFLPISVFICFFTVYEFDRAVIFRLGRLRKGVRGPGLVWHLPCIDSYYLVDYRTIVEEIPAQDVITKDSVSVSVNGVVFYHIDNSLNATIQISNAYESTVFTAQTTLRNMIGTMKLHDLLTSRQKLSEKITIAVEHATAKWGIKIERVEIMEINLPESLQRSLASEAEALRDAKAKIISAEGERNASKALQEASKVMAQNEITLQLRHLSTLTSLAQEHNITIIYPFPMSVMLPFAESAQEDQKKESDEGDKGENAPEQSKSGKEDDKKDSDEAKNAPEQSKDVQEDPSVHMFSSLASLRREKSREFKTPPPEPAEKTDIKSLSPVESTESNANKKGTQTDFLD